MTSTANQMMNARHASHSAHRTQRTSRRMCMSGLSPVVVPALPQVVTLQRDFALPTTASTPTGRRRKRVQGRCPVIRAAEAIVARASLSERPVPRAASTRGSTRAGPMSFS